MVTDNVEKWMWKYLIDRGSILESMSYYGNLTDFKKTEQFKASLDKFGINWNKTEGVKDDYEDMFMGTFCESAKVTFLRGKIALNNGKTYELYYQYDEPMDVMTLVAEHLPEPSFD